MKPAPRADHEAGDARLSGRSGGNPARGWPRLATNTWRSAPGSAAAPAAPRSRRPGPARDRAAAGRTGPGTSSVPTQPGARTADSTRARARPGMPTGEDQPPEARRLEAQGEPGARAGAAAQRAADAGRRRRTQARPADGADDATSPIAAAASSDRIGQQQPALAEPVDRLRAGQPDRQHQASRVSDSARLQLQMRAITGAPMRRNVARSASADQHHQHHAEQRRHDQRRPDLHGLAVVGAAQQARAEAGLRAGRQLADDGADQADGDGDFQAGEQERRRGRPAQLAEHLRLAGAVGAHQVELQRIGRAQSLHHADGDREEAQIHRDDRLGQQAVKPRLPSTTTTIGAIARIGTVCEAMIQGSRLRSSMRRWTMPTASTMPSTLPKTKPTSGRRDR